MSRYKILKFIMKWITTTKIKEKKKSSTNKKDIHIVKKSNIKK